MALTVDINPWGKVLDYKGKGNLAELARGAYLEEGALVLDDIRDGELDIRIGRYVFQLKVDKVLGGNQWNVWKNLSVLKDLFPGLDAYPHFGLGDERAIARRALYLPGLPKVNLTRPVGCGHLLFERAPVDQNFMISSAPHGEGSEPYWKALHGYLCGPGTGKFYFNPGSHQVHGSIPREVFEGMHGRVSILQTNEPEAATFAKTYGGEEATEKDLPNLMGAEWTVVSLGARGLRLYPRKKEVFEVGISDSALARRVLGEGFREGGHDVGCGDATLAALIAVKETQPDVDPKKAADLAMDIASIQYRHNGSNLSALYPDYAA